MARKWRAISASAAVTQVVRFPAERVVRQVLAAFGVVYDGNTKIAHLIGVEHINSEKAFQALPVAQEKFWHPHDGEVHFGILDLPGMPEEQKKGLSQKIRTTHGKTWNV